MEFKERQVYKLFIGIDVSKKTVDFAILSDLGSWIQVINATAFKRREANFFALGPKS
jgi:hypothetical protein